jgi:hypothetical protein
MCAKPHSVSLSSCGLKSPGDSRTTAVCNACDAEEDVSANPDDIPTVCLVGSVSAAHREHPLPPAWAALTHT